MRSAANRFYEGDVLYSRLRPYLNKVHRAATEGLCSAEFIVFPRTDALDADFLRYRLNASDFVRFANSLDEGDRPRVDFGQIGAFEFWLPPLPTQHRIVQALEEKLSRLDAAQSALLRAQANLKRYRASVLKKAYGFDASAANLRSFPWSTIGDQFRVEVGATPSRKEPTYWQGHIPWVSSGEVQFCRVHETTEKITDAGYQNSSTKLNPAGSVLLGMIGQGRTRGQAAILEIEAANNQNCAAIWVSKTPTPSEYVYYWLMLQYDETRRVGSGNNQQALNKSLVQSLPIPWPPLETQHQIVTEVERHLTLITRTEQSLQTQLARAKRLRQSILQQAFAPETCLSSNP